MVENKAKEYEDSIRLKFVVTEEDVERDALLIMGEEGTRLPSVENNYEAAFERFEKIRAQQESESLQRRYFNKYGEDNRKIVEDELRELNEFVHMAWDVSVTEAFKIYRLNSPNAELYEYSRLRNGYYRKVRDKQFDHLDFFPSKAVEVYGKYVLFKKWLEKRLVEFRKDDKLKLEQENLEFIKGETEFSVSPIPSGKELVIITKGDEVKMFSIRDYFKMHEMNWTIAIDNEKDNVLKLHIVNNAIADFTGEFTEWYYISEIEKYVTQSIEYLKACRNRIEDRIKYKIETQQSEDADMLTDVDSNANDTIGIIKKHLHPLKEAFNCDTDYEKGTELIAAFFSHQTLKVAKPIFVKSGNIRKLALALGEIWRSQKNEPISYEYLMMYKKIFSIFEKQTINKKNVFSDNIYKYSIS